MTDRTVLSNHPSPFSLCPLLGHSIHPFSANTKCKKVICKFAVGRCKTTINYYCRSYWPRKQTNLVPMVNDLFRDFARSFFFFFSVVDDDERQFMTSWKRTNRILPSPSSFENGKGQTEACTQPPTSSSVSSYSRIIAQWDVMAFPCRFGHPQQPAVLLLLLHSSFFFYFPFFLSFF